MSTRGVYGLSLDLAGFDRELCTAPAHWASWKFEWSTATPTRAWTWSSQFARLPLRPSGEAEIDAIGRRTVLVGTDSVGPGPGLLHPQLGSTALAAATWRGDAVLHAGVIALDGRAWVLLGSKGAGKSSALAWAHQHGYPVIADDLMVSDGSVVRTGPRFLDLRHSAAAWFDAGTDVGVLGTRRRWRVALPEAPAEIPLAGIVELVWSDGNIATSPIDLTERMSLLLHHRGLQLPVDTPRSMLEVLTKSFVRFERPKSFDALDEAMGALVDRLRRTP